MPEQTQAQTKTQTLPDVRKTVTVAATPDDCFKVFTERPARWWPPTHILVRKERAGLAFEEGVGGRYYEWDVEGTEAVWGRVLEWVPGRRLSMTWRIDPDWQSIPTDEGASQIEVDFEAVDAEHTKVSLAHVKLDRHGPGAERIFKALDGPSPGETLERFARAIAEVAAEAEAETVAVAVTEAASVTEGAGA